MRFRLYYINYIVYLSNIILHLRFTKCYLPNAKRKGIAVYRNCKVFQAPLYSSTLQIYLQLSIRAIIINTLAATQKRVIVLLRSTFINLFDNIKRTRCVIYRHLDIVYQIEKQKK